MKGNDLSAENERADPVVSSWLEHSTAEGGVTPNNDLDMPGSGAVPNATTVRDEVEVEMTARYSIDPSPDHQNSATEKVDPNPCDRQPEKGILGHVVPTVLTSRDVLPRPLRVDDGSENDLLDNFFSLSDPSSSSEEGDENEIWAEYETIRQSKNRRKYMGAEKLGEHALEDKMTWDYSFSTVSGGSSMLADKADKDKVPLGDRGSQDPPQQITLDLIYETMLAHRAESKQDSARTQGACRKLQNAVRRVGRACSDIGASVGEAESRISVLEDDLAAQKSATEAMKSQKEDVLSRLTDLENRMRRNNLRVLGIPEGVEGEDIRKFITDLFLEALPELTQWDWQKELQRVHRFPFQLRSQPNNSNTEYHPRTILISLNNFLAREALFDLARPNKKRAAKGCNFFVRPDFCQETVTRRWHLRQLIPLFQAKESQAFLLSPAKLKVVYKGQTTFFLSEIQAREYLQFL